MFSTASDCLSIPEVSLRFNGHLSRRTCRTSRYQNFSILDFVRAKDGGGGGDNRTFYRPDALPVAQPKHRRRNSAVNNIMPPRLVKFLWTFVCLFAWSLTALSAQISYIAP